MRLRANLEIAAAEAKVGLLQEMQFRIVGFLQLLGFLIEPAVLLVVWRTVAEESGSIGTYSSDEIVAYYVVWTLVRAMNLALTPYVWEWWIQFGRVSHLLMHPASVYLRTVSNFAGMKVLWFTLWVPVGAVLFFGFDASIDFSWRTFVFGFFALWGAYFVRASYQFLLGLIGFWTTRVAAIFEVIMVSEILLSGRLVPLSVMPDWVQSVSDVLPFKWTFQFPIEVIIGRTSDAAFFQGVGTQLIWIVGLATAVRLVWSRAVRRYTAVGS